MPKTWLGYARRHHVGLLALFVALGGTSLAATQIPGPGGVIHACYQKRGGALNVVAATKRCRRGQRALAFNQTGPQGSQGIQGPAGQPGAPGKDGAPGNPAAYPSVLPSGRTEVGVYAVRDKADAIGETIAAAISFPLPLAAAPEVSFAPNVSCPGTVAEPAAAPGTLCIYAGQRVNASDFATDDQGNVGSATRQGASVQVYADGAGDVIDQGSWAVTAP